MKSTYVTTVERPERSIRLGTAYRVRDYTGHELPGYFKPIRQDGAYYVCRSDRGRDVWIKPEEFLREVPYRECPVCHGVYTIHHCNCLEPDWEKYNG